MKSATLHSLGPVSRDWKKILCGVGIALAFGFAASSSSAATAVVYTNDFEAFTDVAEFSDDTVDADPTGEEWLVSDDNPLGFAAGSGVQVINWTNSTGGPNKALLLRAGSEAQVRFYGARSGSRYQLDFLLYAVKEGTANRNWYIVLRGEGTDINGDDFLAYQSLRDSTTTESRIYDGVGPGAGAWVNTGLFHINHQWQHHRVIIDPNALTLDLYIDDMETPALTGWDLSRSEVPVPTLLRIIHEGNSADDGYMIIDNISLTVEDSKDLTTTITEGFEDYPARTSLDDDADPQGPWVTTEIDGTGQGRERAPGKVQVVDSSVVPAHSGTKSLKLEAGQRAGATIAWGIPPLSDVQITWWARVPASVAGTQGNYLRMSLYGAEDGNTVAGDTALLGYGSRDATLGDETSLTYYVTAWVDSGVDYTPDTWEEYRLITHSSQGRYTIIKNPSSANPEIIVDRGPFIGTALQWTPIFMVAWSSSNGTNHPPVYIDDIEIKSLVSNPDPIGDPYTITNYGSRFTNWTIVQVNAPVGKPVVDPTDNSTIYFTIDAVPPLGGIYRAQKIGSGNWAVDLNPIVAGLDRPSGLAIESNGTLWWTHDFTMALMRLKAPYASNTPETIVTNFGNAITDDDPIDVTVAPANFTGAKGQPGMIVVADRGSDGDEFNALNLIDPNTTELNQTNNTFLVDPTSTDLGGNMNAVASLPTTGEILTLTQDGYLVAVNADGALRYINALTLWPFGGPAAGAALAVDPVTGKIWVADDLLDELWSVDATTAEDVREVGFPLTNPDRPERQIDFHEPGMAFAPDGNFLVVSDTSAVSGGRLVIFHNEAVAIPSFSISEVKRTDQGVELTWQSAGSVTYRVFRGTNIANPASFIDISGPVTGTGFTDTNSTLSEAFYRVVAQP